MKKLISAFMAVTMLLPSLFAMPVSAENNSYLFKDDFEGIKLGGKLETSGDVYREVAQLGYSISIWNGVHGSYEIAEESETAPNHVLKIVNKGTAAETTTLTKSVRIDTSNNGVHCFELSFKMRSMGQAFSVSAQSYGGSGGTIRPFVLNGINVSCLGNVGSNMEMDKWNSVRMKFDLDSNLLELYINNICEYTGIIWSDYADRKLPGLMVLSFDTKVEGGKECYFDDFMVSESTGVTDEVVADRFDQYRGVHPRLLADNSDFERIKELVKREEYRSEWDALLRQADGFVENGAKVYYDDSSLEDGWMRDESDAVMNLCMVAKLTGEEKYRKALRDAVATIMNYPQWGREEFYNSDLACAHCLTLASLYYDWFYDDLDPNEKYLIQCTVAERGGRMAKLGWWKQSYLQNHSWNCSAALMLSSAAFFDDLPETKTWAYTAKRIYDNIFSLIGSDGASHEGTMYWSYGLRFMGPYINTAEKLLGLDYSNSGYVKNTAKYFENMFLQTNSNPATAFRFSDYADNIESMAVATLTYLAGRNNDPVAKWYAEYLRKVYSDDKKHFYAMWYLMYLDESLKAESPKEANVPLNTYFDDLGIFFMRTGWLDNETAIAYRCGPAVGRPGLGFKGNYDLGTGHIHNDVNSMQIFAEGEHLLAETTYGGQATASHNTILVNNCGQLPDAAPENGFPKIRPRGENANPHITKIEETDEYVYSIGDGTEIYDFEKTGLKKWKRHFLFLKPGILLIVDDIETEVRDEKIPVEIRYFPEEQNYIAKRDGSFDISNPHYNFRIKPFPSGHAAAEGTKVYKLYSHSNGIDKTVVRIINDDSKMIVPVAMSWSAADKTPVAVSSKQKDNGVVEFYTDDEIITVDTVNEKVDIDKINSDIIIKVDGVLQHEVSSEMAFKQDRFFVNAEHLKEYFGINTETDGDKAVFRKSNITAEAVKGSNIISSGVNEVEMDVTPFIQNGELYVPIRFILQMFKMSCEYRPEIRTMNVTTGVDFGDVSLYSLTVSNIFVPIEDGKDSYELQTFDKPVSIAAVPNVSAAEVKVTPCEGAFGTTYITITSGDGSKEKTYTVTTIPYTDICGTAIHDFGVSASDSNVGENAFDHSMESRWSAQGKGQYIWYDLGSSVGIEEVQIAMFNGSKRTTEFDIEVSDDGENYINVGHFTSSGTTDGLEAYKLDNAKGRFIRFIGYGASGSGWNSLSEFGVKLKE